MSDSGWPAARGELARGCLGKRASKSGRCARNVLAILRLSLNIPDDTGQATAGRRVIRVASDLRSPPLSPTFSRRERGAGGRVRDLRSQRSSRLDRPIALPVLDQTHPPEPSTHAQARRLALPRPDALPARRLGREGRRPPPASLLFTASDLPELAGASRSPGPASTPSRPGLRPPRLVFQAQGQAITLDPDRRGADAPAELDDPRHRHPRSRRGPQPRVRRPEPGPAAPVPAILSLSTDPGFTPSKALDLIRGRLNRPPRRPTGGGSRSGPTRRAPTSSRRPRPRPGATGPGGPRAAARHARALADAAEDRPMQPQGLRQARPRRLHDREGRPGDPPRLLPRGNLYRPTGQAGRGRWCSARTATGRTGGSTPTSSRDASGWRSSAASSSSTTWSATPTASRSATRSSTTASADGA